MKLAFASAFFAFSIFCNLRTSAFDPLPVRDFFNESFGNRDFVLSDLFSRERATVNTAGGTQHPANIRTFPALQTLGASATLLRIAPCGINSPHTHPRATEQQYLFQGTLAIGFVDTRGNYFANIVREGDTFVFPRGMLHFEINVGTMESVSLAYFNSELSGTLSANEAYKLLPKSVLAATFAQSADLVEDVFYSSNRGVTVDEECLKALRNGTVSRYAQQYLVGRK